LQTRGPISLKLGRAGLDAEPSCPNTDRASIGAPAFEVDPAHAFLRVA
jgi:hypothetical protein